MMPIQVKITQEQRDYVDKEIKRGAFASYGHSFRYLLSFYKKNKRVIERVRAENAILRDSLGVYKGHGLDKETAFPRDGLGGDPNYDE